jgi:hypothetical protein
MIVPAFVRLEPQTDWIAGLEESKEKEKDL